MKKLLFLALIILSFTNVFAQENLQKIYDTEKAFEKAVAEKGINQAFFDFSSSDGTCLFPGYPVNCREYFKTREASPSALFWNPTFIDVSSNGAIGYSTGNSVYKPKGKDDPNNLYGEYATIWQRQSDGTYKAALDIGISHNLPNNETKWMSPADSGKELNEKKYSAADTSTSFFEISSTQGVAKAYKSFLADDARLLREGKMPIFGKQEIFDEVKKDRSRLFATKRSIFIGAADMAYISNSYLKTDGNSNLIERGNFLQVWKFRNNKWQIVLDVFVPNPPEKK